MQRRNASRRRRGFTLLEVLLVMAILIIMVSVVTIGYTAIQRNAQSDGARMNINALDKACVAFQLDVGRLPSSLADLVSQPQNVAAGKWRGPYIEQVPMDPWGQEYQYQPQTVNNIQKPYISSAGPDMQPQTQDDVSNMVVNR